MNDSAKRVLIIHGYGIGTSYPVLGQFHKSYNSFSAFRKQLLDGSAKIFYWYNETSLDFIQTINVFNQIPIYRSERQKAASDVVLNDLYNTINQFQPEVIVCHSMGAYLFWNYQLKYNLPDYVKKIVFVQGDLPRKNKITNYEMLNRLKSGGLTLINCYCPWDFTLPFSMVFNRAVPIGLFGYKARFVKNKLFPLYRYIHLHESSIRDPRFGKFVLDDVVNL